MPLNPFFNQLTVKTCGKNSCQCHWVKINFILALSLLNDSFWRKKWTISSWNSINFNTIFDDKFTIFLLNLFKNLNFVFPLKGDAPKKKCYNYIILRLLVFYPNKMNTCARNTLLLVIICTEWRIIYDKLYNEFINY